MKEKYRHRDPFSERALFAKNAKSDAGASRPASHSLFFRPELIQKSLDGLVKLLDGRIISGFHRLDQTVADVVL